MKFEYTFSTEFFTIIQWKTYNPDNQIIKYSSETKVKDGKVVDKHKRREKRESEKRRNVSKPARTHACKQTNTILVQLYSYNKMTLESDNIIIQFMCT